jgi:drug/metabolite transporter (DMT)-like permease
MSTTKPTSPAKANLKRWAAPALGLAIGIAYLIAGWSSGDLALGIQMFGIMLLFTAGLVLASRKSETVKGLLDRQDERISAIDLKATAFAGSVVISAIIIAFVVEIAQEQDGMPYTWLGALGGVSYLAAVIALRVRR